MTVDQAVRQGHRPPRGGAPGGGPAFGILGPLEVTADGRPIELGGAKQRELLAMLLVHLNQPVSAGRLVEALWGRDSPAAAEVTLRTHVLHLRRRLAGVGAAGALFTRRPGYGLLLDPERLDAVRFAELVGLGQEALGLGDAKRAAELLRDGLSLWRGSVLEDLGHPLFAEAEAARLDDLRLVALEGRLNADLALGRHRDVVAELERLVAAHPFRERFCGQLMLALYRSGRQVDALAVYAAAKERLADELGLDPGPALSELQTAVLRQDPALLQPADRSAPQRVRPTARRSSVTPPPDALLAVVRRVLMVGRAGELERLCTQWQAVRDGDRRVVIVSGEAGVGKTRLVAEFAHLTTAEDPVLLVGRCGHTSAIPYHPIASALRASPEVDDVLATAPEAIRGRLAPLLDEPRSASDGDSGASSGERLFDAVGWLIAQVAAIAPVVLVVEDSERIDRSSSLLLRHLVAHLPQRTLVILCLRDPPEPRHTPLLELLGDLEGRGLADRITLNPLSEEDLSVLVVRVTSRDANAAFVSRLWHNTGGNPFYATEVARDLEARGELDGARSWRVPTGVRDVLRHRLHVLPERVQHVVCCAAVLGRVAEFELLSVLADEPEDELIGALEQAVDAGLLVESGSSWKVSYAFPHDLMRDAVYADVPVLRRQRLHLRAGQALRSRRAGDLVAAAVHLRAAGPAADPVDTAELSFRAADQARRLYAWDEAVAHAEAAVAILRAADASAERQAAAAVRTAMLRLKSSIGFPQAVGHLEAALEQYRAAGDDAGVAVVHSRLGIALCTHHSVMDIPRALDHFAAAKRQFGDDDTAMHLHRGIAQAAMFGLRTEMLGESSERAYELALASDRRELTVLPSWGRAWHRFNRGELAEAAAIHAAMWEVACELADPYLGWASVNAAALCATEFLLDPGAGRAWCRRGLTQARFDTFGYQHDAVVDQLVIAMAYSGDLPGAHRAAASLPDDAVSRRLLTYLDGDWEAAERAWAAALGADEAGGDVHDAALNARWLAGVRLMLGDEPGAVAALRRALSVSIDGHQVPTELAARAELARALAVSEVDESAGHLRRCDEILAAGEDWRGRVGCVELARGAVAAARGDERGCDAAHEEAVRIFAVHRLPWHRAAALHAWARHLLAAGRLDDARAKHAASGQVYDEIGAAQRWRRPLTEP